MIFFCVFLEVLLVCPCLNFVVVSPVTARVRTLAAAEDDDNKNASLAASQEDLFAALRARSQELVAEKVDLLSNWRSGTCASRRVVVLEDDWVRRCAMDYPLCALGTASGGVHVADLDKEPLSILNRLTGAPEAHPRLVEGQDLRKIYGEFDGGGVTALALRGETVVSGGRDGEIKIWLVTPEKFDGLVSEFTHSKGSVVSSVIITKNDNDEDVVFSSSLDGTVRRYDTLIQSEVSRRLPRQWNMTWELQRGAAVSLCVLSPQLLAVGGEENVSVFRFDGTEVNELQWPLQSVCRSLAARENYLYAGLSDGKVLRRKLNEKNYDSEEESLVPQHNGPVVSMDTRDSILCTGGQDGTLRLWDLAQSPPSVLFGFGGFKVWLGSVSCDDARLCSDGSDNTIILHDFTKSAEGQQLKPMN